MGILKESFARVLVLIAVLLSSLSIAIVQAQDATPAADENLITPTVSRGVRGEAPGDETGVLGLWSLTIEPDQAVTIGALNGVALGIVERGEVSHNPSIPQICPEGSCYDPTAGADFVWPANESVEIVDQSGDGSMLYLLGLTTAAPAITAGNGTLETLFSQQIAIVTPGEEIVLSLEEFELVPGSRAKLTISEWPAFLYVARGQPALAVATDDDAALEEALASPSSEPVLFVEPGAAGAIESPVGTDPSVVWVVSVNDMAFIPMPGCSGRCLRSF